jgi:hypothetical protein
MVSLKNALSIRVSILTRGSAARMRCRHTDEGIGPLNYYGPSNSDEVTLLILVFLAIPAVAVVPSHQENDATG